MATFAVGDIHGQVAPLVELLERITPEVSAGDTVVFLGDYIDRGRDSRACVETILAFIASSPAEVVCLLGNHEEWMLEALRDPTHHSWLLGMEALAIEAAARDNRQGLYGRTAALPYDRFLTAMPDSHRGFFERLRLVHGTPDCVCSHGGLDPRIEALAAQGRALVWGGPGFPEEYDGSRPVVHGHHNSAVVGDDGWPRARVVGRTYGLDTIAHGVLTAVRLPGPRFFQSGRCERRHDD